MAPSARPANATYRIADIELASRLSFFLWGTVPDARLVQAAMQKTLSTPAGLEAEVKRMLADPRAEALSGRFASQWRDGGPEAALGELVTTLEASLPKK